MTRREYDAITEVVRTEYERGDHSLREVQSLQRLIPALGKAISAQAGLNVNGNRRFTTEKFMLACGVHEELAWAYHGQD